MGSLNSHLSMTEAGNSANLLVQLAQIRERFLQRAQGELPLLRKLLWRIEAGDSTELLQLQIFAHRICGSAATFEFAAISERARQLEKLLDVLIGTSGASLVGAHDLCCLVECGQRLVLEIGTAASQGSVVQC
jgi:HPt (histidine-containing phosphotransfer) domain-containing protein